MNYEIVVATTNKHKMEEYRSLIKNLPITLYSITDLNLKVDAKENGKSYEENSLIKAKSLQNLTILPILADDSGIEIDCLGNNFPGIYSHRFSEENGGQKNTNQMIVEKAKETGNNKARFTCFITVLNINNEILKFVGKCEGHIDAKINQGTEFGYDPIFIEESSNKVFCELSKEEKNALSHRGKAFKKFLTYLRINQII